MNPQQTILIVDDTEVNRYWRWRVLRQAGFEVLEAATGADCLRVLESHPVHLVVLDVQLPDISGLEVCRRIKADPRTGGIPVLQVSAQSTSVPDQIRGLVMGADAYLTEPVPPGVLVATARALLRMRGAEDALRQQNERLRVLSDAAEYLLTADDPGGMIPGVFSRLAGPLGLDMYFNYMVEPPGDSLRLASSGGLTPEQRSAVARLRLGEGICGSVAQTRAPAAFGHIQSSDDARASIVRSLGVAAYACNPLIVGDRLLGTLSFATRRREEFPAEDISLFRTISRYVASAMERAMLIGQLREHGETLEHQVRRRTAELEDSHERLRLSERMAALGTLSAGLGHDMGNLLLPVRIRIDSMERRAGGAEFREDITAIRQCAEYLQQLANGLRLFALDPDDAGPTEGRTDLHAWWPNVEPFLRNPLPRSVTLEHDLPDDLPPVGVSPQGLTQAVFNLVQNAGDVMRGGAGRVRISAERLPGGRVAIGVADDGPGMTDEVRRRCIEPFFTTKTRGISTGLGLALVHGIVQKAGGEIDIDSTLGRGTTFTLVFPAASEQQAEAAPAERPIAVITVEDPRIQSYVRATLQAMGFDTHLDGDAEALSAVLWVAQAEHRAAAASFVRASALRRAVLLGGAADDDQPGVASVPDPRSSAMVQERLREAVVAINAADQAEQESVP